MFAPHFNDEIAGRFQQVLTFFGAVFCCDSNLLAKKLSLDVFLGCSEAPNILRYGKLLAPQFEDEIAGLQKWPFVAGFELFWTHFVCM